jgi:hypothetical protein
LPAQDSPSFESIWISPQKKYFPCSVAHSHYNVQESHAIFGTLTVTVSSLDDSLPQAKAPFLLVTLSIGFSKVNALSSGPYPSLTVQLPTGEG